MMYNLQILKPLHNPASLRIGLKKNMEILFRRTLEAALVPPHWLGGNLSFSGLQVHAAQQVSKRVRAQRIENRLHDERIFQT